MNELSVNEFLLKGRIASDTARNQGKLDLALHILQITSLIALRSLPPTHKVICSTCHKQLRSGKEVEFYNRVGMCYTCDSAYSDTLTELTYGYE